MMLFVMFALTFLAMFALLLNVHATMKTALTSSVAVACMLSVATAIVASVVGDQNTMTGVYRSYTYEFKSLSADHNTGELVSGGTMSLPPGCTVKCEDEGRTSRLEVTTYCLVRMNGWWTPFDVGRYFSQGKQHTEATLYIARKPQQE